MLDEQEFLSPYGIRALSRSHRDFPYVKHVGGMDYRVDYEPAESTSDLFGGNSNWRGPIWFPMNYLIIESLQKYHFFYGESFKVECPTGSGTMMTLAEVAAELSQRLCSIFLRDASGRRPVYERMERFQSDPLWNDLLLFFEYFDGDAGAGIGASHQTGWTGLIAKLLQQSSNTPPVSRARETGYALQSFHNEKRPGSFLRTHDFAQKWLRAVFILAAMLCPPPAAPAQKPMMAVDKALPLSAEQTAEGHRIVAPLQPG